MFIYIISCSDNSLYTGITSSIEKRLKEHKNQLKTCAKYTKSHQMTNLVALWKTEEKTNACKLEYWLKTLSHNEKLQIIQNNNLSDYFNEKIDCSIFIRSTKTEIDNLNALL